MKNVILAIGLLIPCLVFSQSLPKKTLDKYKGEPLVLDENGEMYFERRLEIDSTTTIMNAQQNLLEWGGINTDRVRAIENDSSRVVFEITNKTLVSYALTVGELELKYMASIQFRQDSARIFLSGVVVRGATMPVTIPQSTLGEVTIQQQKSNYYPAQQCFTDKNGDMLRSRWKQKGWIYHTIYTDIETISALVNRKPKKVDKW